MKRKNNFKKQIRIQQNISRNRERRRKYFKRHRIVSNIARNTHNPYKQSKQKRQRSNPFINSTDKRKNLNDVYAPSEFSLVNNTEEVIKFINKIEHFYNQKKGVWVVLKNVTKLDVDAASILLPVVIQFKKSNIKFNGDVPRDPFEAHKLEISGFFEALAGIIKPSYERYIKKNRYRIDGILTHYKNIVDASLAEDIVLAAGMTIHNEKRRYKGVYLALIELMTNTINHASDHENSDKHWWCSIYHNRTEKKVVFSFVDYGIGIFNSLDTKPAFDKYGKKNKFANWKKFFKSTDRVDRLDLMKRIVSGNFHITVTGKHFRGKGLPGICERQKMNLIDNLIIITNDVYANVKQSEYRLLDNEFSGTFIQWEVNESTKSFAWEN